MSRVQSGGNLERLATSLTGGHRRTGFRLPAELCFAVVTSAYLDHIAPEQVVAVIRERNWELPERW